MPSIFLLILARFLHGSSMSDDPSDAPYSALSSWLINSPLRQADTISLKGRPTRGVQVYTQGSRPSITPAEHLKPSVDPSNALRVLLPIRLRCLCACSTHGRPRICHLRGCVRRFQQHDELPRRALRRSADGRAAVAASSASATPVRSAASQVATTDVRARPSRAGDVCPTLCARSENGQERHLA